MSMVIMSRSADLGLLFPFLLIRLCVFERPAARSLISACAFGYSPFLCPKHEAKFTLARVILAYETHYRPPEAHCSQGTRAQLAQGEADLVSAGVLHI